MEVFKIIVDQTEAPFTVPGLKIRGDKKKIRGKTVQKVVQLDGESVRDFSVITVNPSNITSVQMRERFIIAHYFGLSDDIDDGLLKQYN